MRYLGLDLGVTSLGVAATDSSNTIAFPVGTIKFAREDYNEALEKLKNVIDEYEITTLVLGLPKNMDGSLGFAAQRSLEFKKKLDALGLEVVLEDERLTTVEALNIMKNNGMKKINRRGNIDAASAVIILEGYLKRVK